MRVEYLYTKGCPGAEPSLELLNAVLCETAPGTEVTEVLVTSDEQARALGFQGSPSIRVDGMDLEANPSESTGLTRRLYEGGGAPPRWLVEAAVLRALGSRRFLFLCVANSARSQLAESIARHLLGSEFCVQSAGSEPTSVRPEAVEVLGELGIESGGQSSKSVQSIDPKSVEVVITLCAEEVCPVFLGSAIRLHWGLPDPAAVEGPERLDAFRGVRDELLKRMSSLRPR